MMELFVDRNGHVFLLSNDSELLNDKGAVIRQYALNTYPSIPVEEVSVEHFDSARFLKENRQPYQDELERAQSYCQSMEEDERIAYLEEKARCMPNTYSAYCEEADNILKKQYLYALALDLILPFAVKIIFDLSHRYQKGAGFRSLNCHAAALIASGIFPTTRQAYAPSISPNEQYGIDEVMIDELAPGDIISLNHDHSMIYLDKDTCISANGQNSKMKIYSIEEVMSIYYKDMEYSSLQDLAVCARFYRKNPNIQYPEPILQSIREH